MEKITTDPVAPASAGHRSYHKNTATCKSDDVESSRPQQQSEQQVSERKSSVPRLPTFAQPPHTIAQRLKTPRFVLAGLLVSIGSVLVSIAVAIGTSASGLFCSPGMQRACQGTCPPPFGPAQTCEHGIKWTPCACAAPEISIHDDLSAVNWRQVSLEAGPQVLGELHAKESRATNIDLENDAIKREIASVHDQNNRLYIAVLSKGQLDHLDQYISLRTPEALTIRLTANRSGDAPTRVALAVVDLHARMAQLRVRYDNIILLTRDEQVGVNGPDSAWRLYWQKIQAYAAGQLVYCDFGRKRMVYRRVGDDWRIDREEALSATRC